MRSKTTAASSQEVQGIVDHHLHVDPVQAKVPASGLHDLAIPLDADDRGLGCERLHDAGHAASAEPENEDRRLPALGEGEDRQRQGTPHGFEWGLSRVPRGEAPVDPQLPALTGLPDVDPRLRGGAHPSFRRTKHFR